jgi:hypothetical protein
MKENRRTLISLAALLLCILLFFSSFIFSGKAFFAAEILQSDPLFRGVFNSKAQNFQMGDITALVYPREQYFNRAMHEGKPSLWDPHLFCGFPYLTDSRTGIFYPPRMALHRLFPVETALSLLMMLHLFMAGAGMFALARSFNHSHRASLLAAIIWAFSGTSTTWLEFTEVLYVSAFFPWIVLFVRKSFMRSSILPAAAAGVLLGLYHLVAQLQFSMYMIFFLIAYALYALAAREARPRTVLLSTLTVIFFAEGISAVQMLPAFQMLGEAQRVTFTWKEIVDSYSVPFWSLPLLFICPDIMGNPALGIHFFPRGEVMYHEICFYTGIISIPLAAAAAAGGSRLSKLLVIIIAVSWLCASATPFYRPFFTFFPMLNKMIPGRIVYLVTFAMALLATMGLDALSGSERARKAFRAASGFIVLFYAALFGITFLLQHDPRIFMTWLSAALPHVQYPFHSMKGQAMYVEYVQAVLSYYNPLNLWLFLPALLVLTVSVLTATARRVSLSPGFLERVIVVFTAVELILFGLRFLPVTAGETPTHPPHIAFLEGREKPFRVLNLTGSKLNNLFSVFGIDTVQGSLSMYPRLYQMLMNAVETGFQRDFSVVFGNSIELTDYRSPVFDMLNVRYVIMPPDRAAGPGLTKVYDGTVAIYQKVSALPRAWLVKRIEVAGDDDAIRQMTSGSFSPRDLAYVSEYPSCPPDTEAAPEDESVEIASYRPDEMLIDVRCREKSLLVISDVYHSGWKATVDGRRAAIVRTDYALRGIAVSRGIHRVELRFRPDSVRIGLTVTLLFTSAAFALLAYAVTVRIRRPGS